MRKRIEEVLLVASPYDAFILGGDEHADPLLPEPARAPARPGGWRGAGALELPAKEPRPRLSLTTPHIGDMRPLELARKVRETGPGTPVVLLAFDHREVTASEALDARDAIDAEFLWQGDARLIGAIVRSMEDRLNVENDALGFGVQVILLVEDNVRYMSSFLPVVYDY